MAAYPRGSEWRKWDLHLHAPGTKLNDGYGSPVDWDRFCNALESSDVAAFGITDYFSFDSYFELVDQFAQRYPTSSKVFFPNLELRLNETVNKDVQTVDVHVLLRPDLSKHTANRLLQDLKTEMHEAGGTRKLSCAELNTTTQYETATVTRDALTHAIQTTFGDERGRKANTMVVVAANDSGIRAISEQKRKANLADAIDKMADAMFGNSSNSAWYLRRDRLEDGSVSKPKPVYGGCDAHTFPQLDEWLGKEVTSEGAQKSITWIKADVTFEGLQQTLVEPQERVRIQPTLPDRKEPYKYISRVRFADTSDFPPEIVFNRNLVSIIGSRSSGKSALLAYIAHAIDPAYTVDQQMATGLFDKRSDAGPAAARTWSEVSAMNYAVEWGDPSVTNGKVIYIPQNSLFALSARPNDITAKIQPALYRLSAQYRAAHEQALRTTEAENTGIREAVREWFRLSGEITTAKGRIRDHGDKKAIEATRVSLEAEIEKMRKQTQLTDADVAAFESLTGTFRTIDARLSAIIEEAAALAPYVDASPGQRNQITEDVQVDVRVKPSTNELPTGLSDRVGELVETAHDTLFKQLAAELIGHQSALDAERETLGARRSQLELDNADLIKKNTASAQLDTLIQTHGAQISALTAIDTEESKLAQHLAEQAAHIRAIEDHFTSRAASTDPLTRMFETESNDLDGMSFGFEEQIEEDVVETISERFNKQERSIYIDSERRLVDLARAQREPGPFLDALAAGRQKLKQGVEASAAAVETLCATPAIRFYALLDGDRIGGFERSSMTPGKQALFALTLTLSESEEAWPLLIDQPEDDLDSRAVYDTIVPYLTERKRERQILMVTHNANLVVGADSEQVVVTNRHGEDRKNRGGQTFAYVTGSLEHSTPLRKAE